MLTTVCLCLNDFRESHKRLYEIAAAASSMEIPTSELSSKGSQLKRMVSFESIGGADYKHEVTDGSRIQDDFRSAPEA